jgi:hypothetical protein
MVRVLVVAGRSSHALQGGDELSGLHPVARLGIDCHADIDAPANPRRDGHHLLPAIERDFPLDEIATVKAWLVDAARRLEQMAAPPEA